MPVNASIKLKVFQKDKYRCVECGANSDLTIDHIVPVSKGGSDLLHNLQTMCQSCNLKKSNKHTTFWQDILGFVRPIEMEILSKDLANMMVTKDKAIKQEVQSMTDKRLSEIEPKVKVYINELLKANPLTETGLKNSVEGYGKRSEERDKYLRHIIFLLCDKVEELERRLNWTHMTPEQRKADMDFKNF